jgi:hypothetical protein
MKGAECVSWLLTMMYRFPLPRVRSRKVPPGRLTFLTAFALPDAALAVGVLSILVFTFMADMRKEKAKSS